MMQSSAQKIMLHVDAATASKLNRACGCARYAYNWARDRWLEKKAAGQKTVSIAELRKEFNENKTDWMYESPKGSMDQAIKNFGLAKKRHYDKPRHFKFPKRKKFNSRRSFYIENDKAKLVDSQHIKLPQIKLPVELAEPVCTNCLHGKINNYVISKGSNDRWYVSISYSYDDSNELHPIDGNGIVGIDLGVNTVITMSNGGQLLNPHILKSHERKLRRYQRMMSRRRRGSVNYKKVKDKFAKTNTRIKNVRSDILHKATTEIVRSNMVIAIEDLNVKGMLANHRLASAITDCGFGMIRRLLEYKCKKYGSLLLVIDRFFPSSKKCSECGHVKDTLSLSEREFICEHCGIVLDRDMNAAVNILAEALFSELKIRFNTDLARRKFTPAEIVALAGRLLPSGETAVVDAQCRMTRDGRMALVDDFFNRLRNNVDLSTIN